MHAAPTSEIAVAVSHNTIGDREAIPHSLYFIFDLLRAAGIWTMATFKFGCVPRRWIRTGATDQYETEKHNGQITWQSFFLFHVTCFLIGRAHRVCRYSQLKSWRSQPCYPRRREYFPHHGPTNFSNSLSKLSVDTKSDLNILSLSKQE